jgi:hypothetical protein
MIYRTICTQLWTDKKVQQLSVQGKLLFVYLITNPHTHLSGIYYLPKELILKETGISNTLLHTLFTSLSCDSLNLAHYDNESSTVFVVNMFGYQGTGEKNERAAANQLRGLHDTPLISLFLERYPKVKSFCPDTLLDTVSTLSKRFPSVPVLLTSSLNPLLLTSSPDLKSNGHADEFEQFWSAYPKKVGKKDARKAWTKATDRPEIVQVLRRIEESKRTDQWTKDNGQFIPNPATWINQGRWDDEPVPAAPTTMQAFLSRTPRTQEGLT